MSDIWTICVLRYRFFRHDYSKYFNDNFDDIVILGTKNFANKSISTSNSVGNIHIRKLLEKVRGIEEHHTESRLFSRKLVAFTFFCCIEYNYFKMHTMHANFFCSCLLIHRSFEYNWAQAPVSYNYHGWLKM